MNQQVDFTAFFERSSSLYFIRLNPEGFYTDANQLYCIIFRYIKSEIHQKSFINRFTGETLENLKDTLARVGGGEQVTIDLDLIMPDRTEFWTRWEFSAEYDFNGEFIGIIGIGNDISERKRAELEKKRVQENLEIILSNSDEAFALVDQNLQIISYNRKADAMCREVYGIPLKKGDDALKYSISKVNHQKLVDIYRTVFNGETVEVELKTKTKAGDIKWVRNTFKRVLLKPTSEFGVIFTSREITSRKLAELELLQTRNYFKAIIENSHDGLVILNKDNEITDISPAARRILQYDATPKTLDMRASYVHPDDLPKLSTAFTSIIKRIGSILTIEFRIKTRETSEFKWLYATIQNLMDEPRIQGIVMHFNDITERKEAESALQESEEKYRFLFYSNPQPMWIFDKSSLEILEVNEAAVVHYGYSTEEFRNMTIKDIRPDEDVTRLVEWVSLLPFSSFEAKERRIWRHRKKNGEVIYVEIKSHYIDYQGRKAQLVSVNDLTKMVEAEQELLKSNERFHYAMKATSEAIWEYDLKTETVYRSNSFRKMFGLDPEVNNRYEDFSNLIHADDIDRVVESFNVAVANKEAETWESEYRYLKADGTYAFISDKGWIIREADGTAVRVVGSMRDITDRKEYEVELLKTKERFELVGKATSDALYDLDLETENVHWGEGYLVLFGYQIPKQATMQMWKDKVYPGDLERVLKSLRSAFSSDSTTWKEQYRFYRADGSIAEIVDKALIMRDSTGKPFRIIGAMQDISELKQKEKQLAQERNLLRTLIDHIPDYIYVKDRQFRHIINNKANLDLIGADSEEVTIGKTTGDYFGNAGESLQEVDRQVLNSGEAIVLEESLQKKDSNDMFWLLTTKVPLKNEQDEVIGIVGVSRDITERKRIEESLRQTNERYRIVSKATNDAIWDLDVASSQILWNEGLRAIFGHPYNTTSLEWWREHVHPDDIERVKQGRQHNFSTNTTGWTDEYKFRDSNGEYKMVLDHGYILSDDTGKPYRVIGAMMDITERFLLQEELEKQRLDRQRQITEATIRAQEKERTELGRELHDNINQILTTSKIYIEMAREEPEIREEVLEKSYQYVSSAIDEIRSLSKSLVPPSLGDIGLKEAILDLIENLNVAQKIQISLRTYGLKDVYLDNDLKLMAYRIVQEQLNNVLKHSKSKMTEITLSVVRKSLNIIIRDDGIGFDQSKRGRGIGLNNIMSRAELHHGSVQIDSTPGNGCTLKVSIPIK
jgi:two-component system, NarL family, sensor histidine kinase UhpB